MGPVGEDSEVARRRRLMVSTRLRRRRSEKEENKALVRRFLEAQANGKVDTVKQLMAPDFVELEWSQEEPESHRERYSRELAEEQGAFSDIRYIIEDQIAEGDKVMTRWRGRGVHDRGEYAGFAPTGRESESKVIDIHCVVGGKIAEEWKGTTAVENLQEERLAQVFDGPPLIVLRQLSSRTPSATTDE
jgi:predicted ester cyclase